METFYHPELLDNEILTIQEDAWGRVWFKNFARQLAYIKDGIITLSAIQFKKMKEFCVVSNSLLIFQIIYSTKCIK